MVVGGKKPYSGRWMGAIPHLKNNTPGSAMKVHIEFCVQ